MTRRPRSCMVSRTTVGTGLQWIEPWYLAYALLGAAVGGMVPMAVPLTVYRTGSLAATGMVMSAFNLGGLTTPVWGCLADRYRLHRVLLVWGLLVTTLGLAVFPAVPGFWGLVECRVDLPREPRLAGPVRLSRCGTGLVGPQRGGNGMDSAVGVAA